jgi:hypothetical protein
MGCWSNLICYFQTHNEIKLLYFTRWPFWFALR